MWRRGAAESLFNLRVTGKKGRLFTAKSAPLPAGHRAVCALAATKRVRCLRCLTWGLKRNRQWAYKWDTYGVKSKYRIYRPRVPTHATSDKDLQFVFLNGETLGFGSQILQTMVLCCYLGIQLQGYTPNAERVQRTTL